MDNFLNTINFLKRRAYHVDGLFVAIVFYIVLVTFAAGSALPLIWKAVIFLVGIIALGLGWCFLRRVPRFKDEEIGILFAPHSKENVREELDLLFDEVARLLQQHSLKDKIKIIKLPPNFIITKEATAIKIREKSNCRLLIWGHYEKGNIQDQEFRGFSGNISFTYAVPANENLTQNINKDFVDSISNRRWLFRSSNELIERSFVSGNIAEVSRYIIGTCLLLFNNLELSKIFFTELILNPSGVWNEKSDHNIRYFLNNIKTKLSFIDVELARRLYLKHIFVGGVLFIEQKILEEIKCLTVTSIRNYPDLNAYLLQGIVFFLQNKERKAQDLMAKTRRRWLHNPNPDFSLAFLYAYKGDLRKSKNHYKRGIKLTVLDTECDVFHMVGFQEAVLENDPSRYHLHFSLGIIYLEFLDAQQALHHFQKFIEISSEMNIEKEVCWINESQEYIKENSCY